mgnify:CR=1 FL=1
MSRATRKIAGVATVRAGSMIVAKIAAAVSIRTKSPKSAQNATGVDYYDEPLSNQRESSI